jgi:hypothetical protein
MQELSELLPFFSLKKGKASSCSRNMETKKAQAIRFKFLNIQTFVFKQK